MRVRDDGISAYTNTQAFREDICDDAKDSRPIESYDKLGNILIPDPCLPISNVIYIYILLSLGNIIWFRTKG